MPLPEPSEQDCESLRAGQEPSVGARKPQESSNLVPARDKERPKPTDVASQETSSTATLPNNTLQVAPVKKQGRIIHRKRSRVDAVPPQPLEFLKTPFGGRLLVHKSFLYKQEKAVGDKVYWKCRQHSELSCRGRAITRGFRVTEMRDHCHPPEKEGLDRKKRHRGRPPSSALPEGAEVQEDEVSLWLYPVEPEPTPQPSIETPEEEQGYRSLALQSLPPKKRPTPGVVRYRPLEFLKTCYGGTFLVHQSFLYKREKTVGGKVYWTCREHAVHGCRSRAITQGQRVTVMRSHCHSPDIEGLQARRQQEKTIKKIQARRIGAGDLEDCDDIEDSLLQGVDSLFYRRGQGTLTLSRSKSKSKSKSRSKSKSKSRSRSRKRAKKQQESSQEPPEEDQDVDPRGPEFLKTPLGGNFLVYESFLYRREKVAGEKVYWTCRDQARMGCRSRAITQGRQVTVMRSHCHPPDLLGLETLRQREKRPGPSQWDGPEGPEFLKTPLGGSFLVYESFLYRREKATGDKVYWTCRDQARMGCRSRAITQGQRVMVMRRHCHPPDMGGLEALRQRENFPNLTHWEGPEPLQPLEFLRTSLGGRFLVYESFLYRKEKAAGEKVYWMCRDQARLGCRSRAITQGRRVMVMRSHCHPPDLAGLEALRQREKAPSAAKKKKKKKKKKKGKSKSKN
ncbi:FLYWCH-type zinc finger-containing protein 1 isoform X1 [Mus musculus]|uniref:Isoform 2 of FLYWCH-type zinc finger-containing protein 1 n=2 Tax=Mus musculus TaxID=10090 RepID=Q8CI03-2|nr:FLYWCH-type zinc finger-containing protein 1 isoform 1 [Mus musculus]NP_001344923.1 FLYWCH-type zinc finger-containing protein 1 isoform 1 [Mus musculus]XP_006524145.1 FLYWCH-type zinc finger-containing protein 1 isoform X1 [Mus musculus]XP_006524146.1 FLYWCH-type zinc finger-containing protein 1 isoform X1 [Mus musculus]|eukprot:XP_006524144.1 PREDICTED: FLYWCH-type zinc finger-containing protein 1 isoform X3 [Mus musculus]